MGMQNKALHCWDYGHRWLFIFRDFIGWIICNINRKSPEGNRTRKNKKIKRSEIRAVLIEAKQPFTMLYKYDLVVPWQCVDIGREVDKVKLIILSKISWNILWQWHYCNNWLKDWIILKHIQTINQSYLRETDTIKITFWYNIDYLTDLLSVTPQRKNKPKSKTHKSNTLLVEQFHLEVSTEFCLSGVLPNIKSCFYK